MNFDNLENQFHFKKYVLDNLSDEDDKKYFTEIVKRAWEFENWNYGNLSIGFEKTLTILKSDFDMNEKAAKVIANLAAYDWK